MKLNQTISVVSRKWKKQQHWNIWLIHGIIDSAEKKKALHGYIKDGTK